MPGKQQITGAQQPALKIDPAKKKTQLEMSITSKKLNFIKQLQSLYNFKILMKTVLPLTTNTYFILQKV